MDEVHCTVDGFPSMNSMKRFTEAIILTEPVPGIFWMFTTFGTFCTTMEIVSVKVISYGYVGM